MATDLPSFDLYHPQPLIVVISGPSGVGKDSVIKTMKTFNQPFHFVITAASRAPRPGEIEGVDYFFLSKERFEEMIADGMFIEHSIVYNEHKGIPRSQVEEALRSGKDVILRLDVQGARKLRTIYPQAILIFLIPDNGNTWYQRIVDRKTETEETLRVRLETARLELAQFEEFDYVVINAHDRLEEAVKNIIAIIDAEHHRVHPGCSPA
jgi:guanylate kinase